jgi:carbamoyl-phosphate synthase large subunit
VIPPRSLDDDTMARVREVTEEIATALDTVGLLNVQLAVQDGEVYVLEANPRSSRTVPFVSKATGVPIAKLAAKVMAGESLADLDASEGVPEQYSVKEVVLPFDRLPDSDPRLGPEMKSTGEVMGTASDPGMAYWKAQTAAFNAPEPGSAAVVDLPVGGFDEHFEVAEVEDVSEAIRRGEVDFLASDDRAALTTAVEEEIPYVSTEAAAEAMLEGLAAAGGDLDVAPVGDRPIRDETWG